MDAPEEGNLRRPKSPSAAAVLLPSLDENDADVVDTVLGTLARLSLRVGRAGLAVGGRGARPEGVCGLDGGRFIESGAVAGGETRPFGGDLGRLAELVGNAAWRDMVPFVVSDDLLY